MKIIKLTMNAFMTYKDKTEICFDEMIDHGLYLISGPTGSGKTTIFDAMTFALYGVASGSQRNQSSYFRSDYADNKEETYVEMEFELHNRIYTVRRSPTYTRPGYKTAKMANAYLKYDDTVIEGIKEVNAKINELIGVDVHQFKQIVMIAQGEFTKLIYASSEEREKVLRHIFHSESLVAFENQLKEETKRYKEQYAIANQRLISRFQLLSYADSLVEGNLEQFHPMFLQQASDENQKLHEQVLALKTEYTENKNVYDQFSKDYYEKEKMNESYLQYQQVSQKYTHLMKQEETMNQCQQDIENIQLIHQNQTFLYQYQQTHDDKEKTEKQLQLCLKQKESLENQYQLLQKQYETLPDIKLEKDNLLKKKEKLKQDIEKQNQYKQLNVQYLNEKKTYETETQVFKQLQDHLTKLTNRMMHDQENVNRLARLELDYQQYLQLKKESEEKQATISQLSEYYDTWAILQEKHFELAQKYKAIENDFHNLDMKYQNEDEKFKQQQAGILALGLKENEPCPVCGSTHHPHLAKVSLEVLSSIELEKLNKEVEKSRKRKDNAYQEVLSHNEKIKEIQAKMALLKERLGIHEDLSKEVFIQLMNDVTQEISQKDKQYKGVSDEISYLKKIQKSLKQDEIKKNALDQQCQLQKDKINDIEKRIAVIEKQVEQIEKEVDIHENLNQAYQQVKLQFDEKEQFINQIEKNYHQATQQRTLLQNQEMTLKETLSHLQTTYTSLSHEFERFVNDHFQTKEKYEYYLSLKDTLQDKEKQYQSYLLEKTQLSSQMEALKKTLGDYHFIDLTTEKDQLILLEKNKDEAYEKVNTFSHMYEQNEKIIKELNNEYQHSQDIFEQYTLYQDLSDMATGKNMNRMSFERYVLSAYFEHILDYANVELAKMSQGRFTLYRKTETKGAKQQGLDLSVLDYETGMLRDIQSLSGGESFKAALSLALGLSAMIQSYAGGIELNTLFIDEGFGTLDNESIDQALSVLMELHNDNKVIGIISHVDELKERIPTQIVVHKGVKGSSLSIEK